MMNEKEWVEFFELINGRKPSPADFEQGRLAGEFMPDAQSNSQTAPIQEAETPAPASPEMTQPAAQAPAEPVSPANTPVSPQVNPDPAVSNPGAAPQVFATNQQTNPNMTFQSAPAPKAPNKFTSFFKKKPGKKGWPLWLNLTLTAVVVILMIFLGIFASRSQRKADVQNISGDWQLKEASIYKDDDWDSFYKNGSINTEDEDNYDYLEANFYVTEDNDTLKFYGGYDVSEYLDELGDYYDESDTVAELKKLDPTFVTPYFSVPSHPSLEMTIHSEDHSLGVRADDNDYKEYLPLYVYAKEESDADAYDGDIEELEAKYFMIDGDLTIVYYEDDDPVYMERYETLSKSNANKIKKDAKDHSRSFSDWEKGPTTGDSDSDDSISDKERSAFQAG